MAKRSAIETTVGILSAFLRRRSWKQADLAREVQLEARALRRHLDEMTRRGLPFEREEEPPHVYWSAPKNWFPGGIVLEGDEPQALVQLLCRSPASPARDKLLRRVSSGLHGRNSPLPQLDSVYHGIGDEPPFLTLVTDAAAQRSTLRLQYFSAHRGALEWRHLSVQRVLPGPPARVVAHCHRERRLKWFRVDRILSAQLDATVPYEQATKADVDAYLAESLDGFSGEDTAMEHQFFVPDPDSRWVERNLLPPMQAEQVYLFGGARGVRLGPTRG